MDHEQPPANLYFGIDKIRRHKLVPLPFHSVVFDAHGEYHSGFGAGDCQSCPFFAGGNTDSYGAPVDCGYQLPPFIRPYSIRSVVAQLGASHAVPCHYFVRTRGRDAYGNLDLEDGCMERCPGATYRGILHDCPIVSGLARGPSSCRGLEFLQDQCQSAVEKTFLELYLRSNRDREGPMPIPQCYVDPHERYRVDFALIAGHGHESVWKWIAVEIDSPRFHANAVREERRQREIERVGFSLFRISTTSRILDEVRRLQSSLRNL